MKLKNKYLHFIHEFNLCKKNILMFNKKIDLFALIFNLLKNNNNKYL